MISLSGGVRRQKSPTTGLFRSSTALSRTDALRLLALRDLRTTANSRQGSMTRDRPSHPRAEGHLEDMLLASKCYPSRKGSTGHPGAPDISGEDMTATRRIPPMWRLLYWPLERETRICRSPELRDERWGRC